MAPAKRVVIVGGDAAGMSAASQAVRVNPGLEVVAYERGPYVSYGACGIPYYVSGEIGQWEDLLVMSPEQFQERGITVKARHEVVAVRPAAREVTVRDTASGSTFRDRYDALVLATGASADAPAWQGIDLQGVFALRSLEDGIALREFVNRTGPGRAVIVGTGFIGMEMTEAFLKLGLEVTLVGRSDRVFSSFDAEMARPLLAHLEEMGVKVFLETQVKGLEGRNGAVSGVATDRGTFPADLVLLSVGVKPGAALAAAAGIRLGKTGAVSVTDRMQTDTAGVYAAGDCIEVPHVVTGEKVFAPLALTANRTGRIAGDNLACETLGRVSSQRFRGTAGTAVTKVCEFTVAQTGLSPQQARTAGFDAAVVTRQSRSRAGYYPGGGPIWTRIVVDRKTRRLLGAQMLGKEGVAGRIDVFASALFGRMTVEEIYNLDLAYAPPYGPVYDPVIEICGRAGLELG